MKVIARTPSRLMLCASMVMVAFVLSACGSFDSAASGENLMKDYVKKFGQGKVTIHMASGNKVVIEGKQDLHLQ